MSLAPGSKLGPFEIVAPLGAGGMGEVYRARDTRLERVVAIKILPTEFSAIATACSVSSRKRARPPRSTTPISLPSTNWDRTAPRHYIAMELVEGKTLRELLASGLLPIRRAIEIAAQIAEGLAKAHEAGITHRDLKPENLMISHDGFVKILDFGLAKLRVAPANRVPMFTVHPSRMTRLRPGSGNGGIHVTGTGRAAAAWISGRTSSPSAWCSTRW